MERRRALRSRFRRYALSGFATALAVLALALGPAAAGIADPKPTEKELKRQLAALEKKVDKLIVTYNGKRVALQKAEKAEETARDRLRVAESAYVAAQRQVVDMASLQYQAGGMDLPTAMMGQSLGEAAMLEQLAAEQAAELDGYAKARDERKRAAGDATRLIKEIREQAADVEERRKEAEKLIDKIKDRLDRLVPTGPGKRAGGGWAPQLPTGSDNITPRTRLMRDQVKERFTTGLPIGCYRVDDHGEHPLGRACDFMLSSGGAMPSGDKIELGSQISEWAIKNAGRLGVKYVIYRQRIYNMSSPGWRAMGNRGGITANHFDHVHVSML